VMSGGDFGFTRAFGMFETDIAGLEHAEGAGEAEVTTAHHYLTGPVFAGGAGAVVDGAADGRCSRTVNVSGAEVHIDLLDQLGVDHLIGIDRVVAGVIER